MMIAGMLIAATSTITYENLSLEIIFALASSRSLSRRSCRQCLGAASELSTVLLVTEMANTVNALYNKCVAPCDAQNRLRFSLDMNAPSRKLVC